MKIGGFKTGGVRVSKSVYADVSTGNAARDRGERSEAIKAYRAALVADPSLDHVWIQLGHLLKDSGELDSAVSAYQRAATASGPNGSDALLNLGHVEKSRGRRMLALQYFLQASKRDPAAAVPMRDLREFLIGTGLEDKLPLSGINQLVADLPSVRNFTTINSADASTIVLDCTSFVRSLVDPQSPQSNRAQVRFIDAALAAASDRVRLAYVHPLFDGSWAVLTEPDFREAVAATDDPSVDTSIQPAARDARILLGSAIQGRFEFPAESWLIGWGLLGVSADHSLAVTSARARSNMKYAGIVDDLLPIMRPQFCSEEQRIECVTSLVRLFNSADLILAGSQAIVEDLVTLSHDAGSEVEKNRIVAIPLSAPTVQTMKSPGHGVPDSKRYVVVVGEVSGAKGHMVALDAWVELSKQRDAAVPDLVFIGDRSRTESLPIVRRVTSHPTLSRQVRFAGALRGAELVDLYAGASLILCPTLYEGSDAILADARACGSTIIASDLPVLREVADGIVFVTPGDARALSSAVLRSLMDGTARSTAQATTTIQSATMVVQNIIAALDARADRVPRRTVQQALPGHWHPFTPIKAGQIKRGIGSGADFRNDGGWSTPTANGCWTLPSGGEIAIGLPSDGLWRLSLQLLGLPARGTRWSLEIEGRDAVSGTVDAGAKKWVVLDDLIISDGRLRLFLKGLTHDEIEGSREDKWRPKLVCSVGVSGFHVCRSDDWAAREKLVSTIVLSDLSMLNAYD